MEMAAKPGLWEQNDLLGLLALGPQHRSPQDGDPEPASSLMVAPLQTSGRRIEERQPPAANIASEPAAIDSGNPESPPSPSGLTPQPCPKTSLLKGSPISPEPASLNGHQPTPRPGPQLGSQPALQPIALPTLAPLARRCGPHAPERILILDTETTGLSPEQGVCIEVGAVLFDVGSRAVLQQLSFLLPCQANPAEGINGIPAAVTRLPQPTEAALTLFTALVEAADAVVAHHAAFDRQWFGHGALPALAIPWICSMEDIRWPAELQLRPNPSLRDLALAHRVPVWAAHRALTDCDYLVHVFQRCAQLEALLVAAQEPRELYRARLSYAERHLAREAGFRWNDPVAGAWSRRLSKREVEALPFPVLPVERDGFAEPMAS
jgi:DNA polymerase-3 subunit epsilon